MFNSILWTVKIDVQFTDNKLIQLPYKNVNVDQIQNVMI